VLEADVDAGGTRHEVVVLQQCKAVQSSTVSSKAVQNQVGLMSMLVGLVMKLLYCSSTKAVQSSTKQYIVEICSIISGQVLVMMLVKLVMKLLYCRA
jgi:hypothetical protein